MVSNLTWEMFIREPWAVAQPKASDVPVSAHGLHRVWLDQLLVPPFLNGKAALKAVRSWDADGQTDHSRAGDAVAFQIPASACMC